MWIFRLGWNKRFGGKAIFIVKGYVEYGGERYAGCFGCGFLGKVWWNMLRRKSAS